MKRGLSLSMVLLLVASIILGCSNNSSSGSKDVVKVWTYPVHGEYEAELKDLIASFEKENENIKVEYEVLSWAEGPQKFDIALNSGSPPDVYFGKPQGKYVDTGLAVDLKGKLNVSESDYNEVALDYMKIEEGLYGLPIYMFLHVWGGNKQLLEEAGIDYEKIQKEGWTWKEFQDLAAKGVKKKDSGEDQYGFVFQGNNEELLVHLAMNNGLPNRYTEDGITWNDDRILETMKYIRSLIDSGIMPRETAAIDPAKRMELFYNHQALFFGRAIPYFDPVVEAHNEEIKAGTVEGEEVNFVLLPIPHNEGQEQVSFGGSEGYMLFTQKNAKEDHLNNSIKVLEHLTSAEAGKAAAALALPQVHKDAEGKFEMPLAPYNEVAADVLASKVLPPANAAAALAAKDDRFRTEVVIPTFQGLLSGELTPEAALEEFKKKGEAIFSQ
ncbi:ABC transporter substrate-binding protein [Sutcliffiella halmapala]|uniref:ABC transporter substrate-binding protein n=1 Tax=Sutcliffiella halmapala TaxID=79882 RepID=UPI001F4877AF|nr:extracellular solute-binding protein [Sutcliffiella halmapala]